MSPGTPPYTRDVTSPIKTLKASPSIGSIGGAKKPLAATVSRPGSFGPAAIKELENLKVKYASSQEQVAQLEEQVAKLQASKGNGEEAITNGFAPSGADFAELEKLQAEKQKVTADLAAAMTKLEEKARVVTELQESVSPSLPSSRL